MEYILICFKTNILVKLKSNCIIVYNITRNMKNTYDRTRNFLINISLSIGFTSFSIRNLHLDKIFI